MLQRRWIAIAPALAACSLLYKSDLDDARKRASTTDAGSDTVTPPVVVAEAGADVRVSWE